MLSCEVAALLELCSPGLAGVCIRPDAHEHGRIRMDFRNTATTNVIGTEDKNAIRDAWQGKAARHRL